MLKNFSVDFGTFPTLSSMREKNRNERKLVRFAHLSHQKTSLLQSHRQVFTRKLSLLCFSFSMRIYRLSSVIELSVGSVVRLNK